MFGNLRCRFSGHPLPGAEGKFVAPVPYYQPAMDLPYLDSQCPRCGAALKLYFAPGTTGTNSPAHHMAVMRWNLSQGEKMKFGKSMVTTAIATHLRAGGITVDLDHRS